jgi:lipoprotein-anchoring transpeptidase ErfK/SrfK
VSRTVGAVPILGGVATSVRYAPPRQRGRGRGVLWSILGLLLVAVVAVVAAVLLWSGATLATDPSALARVDLQPFAGKLEQASATGSGGRTVSLVRNGKLLTPATRLTPGEAVAVTVVIKRPGWIGWALGKTRTERLTVTAPVAHVTDRWLTAGSGGQVAVKFDTPVEAVEYGGRRHPARGGSVLVPTATPAGSLAVAAAPRSWERVGAPVRISWFPAAHSPVALATPAPGATLAPTARLRLTFSKPVTDAIGTTMPKLVPATPGHWRKLDSHTIVFAPTGLGAKLGSPLSVTFPRTVAIATGSGRNLRRGNRIAWQVGTFSTMRLQQLLALGGYLPLDWTPDGADVGHTLAAQVQAAVNPPHGTFSWRYPNTPSELKNQWTPGKRDNITRGAIMMFQDTHHLAVDSFAGPAVWSALIKDTLAGKRRDAGYSYVYVHRNVPQLLTLWHNGHTVLTSPGNTGVPAAPTQLGTFPVFEHIPVGTMSGTNPDGSHYHDPGIKWISYFNGGEALHSFNRASFGTPQSLGCVELPLNSAAKLWPYTPIGTLVTIEN